MTKKEKTAEKEKKAEAGEKKAEEEKTAEKTEKKAEGKKEKPKTKETKTKKPEKTKAKEETPSKTYTIPLKSVFGAFKNKRAKNASTAVREFVKKHLKTGDINIDSEVNEFIYSQGMSHVPRRVKVSVSMEEGKALVKLAD